jgi:hypothetical protein
MKRAFDAAMKAYAESPLGNEKGDVVLKDEDIPPLLKDYLDNLDKEAPEEPHKTDNSPEIHEESKEKPRLVNRVMGRYRNFVVSISGLGFVIIGLFPPWVAGWDIEYFPKGAVRDLGYAFITAPPTYRYGSQWLCSHIDLSRLIVEWIVWGLICGTAYLKLNKARPKHL